LIEFTIGPAMISQTAEYALRAVVYLAGQDRAARTTAEIAKASRVPVGYLAKVMQALSRRGLVRAQRGVGGGFLLAHDAARLSVLDVIDAVDPLQRIRHCPLGLDEHRHALCPLHRRLDDAFQRVEDSFRDTTIAELLPSTSHLKPACPFPACP
jgi:Rrf2 family nitric oxide-sensitive transcriptional repressor